MIYTIRPLGPWVGPETQPRAGSSRFKASWSSTLKLLGRELEHLDAERVVFRIDVTEGDLRLDGMLRANARVDHPGVKVSFESKHGPLTYSTDVYEQRWSNDLPGWQANIRAIALALEALRAVDRHGVSRPGEQYTGWKAIGAGPTVEPAMTPREAAGFVAEHLGLDPVAVLIHWPHGGNYYRMAAKVLHPDAGGSTADFQRLQEAKRVLDEHLGAA